jgi:putative peptidoglycan lipid II flippase
MFVIGRLKVAAAALAGCWAVTIVLDVVLVQLVPPHLVAAALAVGNTVGQTAVAIPLVLVTRRICGRASVQGAGHAALAGLAAGAVGAGVGVAVCLAAPGGGKLAAAAVAAVAAGGAFIAFAVVAYLLDRGDLKAVVARLRRTGGTGR